MFTDTIMRHAFCDWLLCLPRGVSWVGTPFLFILEHIEPFALQTNPTSGVHLCDCSWQHLNGS
jgi:hypothetical protein